MKNCLYFLTFSLLLSSCFSKKDVKPATYNLSQTDGFNQEQIDLIASTASQFPDNSQFSLAMVQDSQIYFYGLHRENDELKTIDNAGSVFEIGSITKTFTALLLANMVNSGKAALDQNVQDLLDFKLGTDQTITLQQLSNHTSGLPRLPSNMGATIFNMDNPYADYSDEKLIEYLTEKIKLKQAPGEKYGYSNLGAGFLAFAISRKENKPYEQLLQEQVFEPLGMEHSTTDRSKIADRLVKGTDRNGKPTSNWDLASLAGAGAILSSVTDLSKYAQFSFDSMNGELAMLTKKTHAIHENLDISLGWHIFKNITKNPIVWHNGGTGGYKSSMGMDIEKRAAIIILTNIGSARNDRASIIDDLCFELMKTLEDK